MVVDEIHLEGITAFEPENQSLVSGDSHAPKTLQPTLQKMQTPAGEQRDPGGLLERCGGKTSYEMATLLLWAAYRDLFRSAAGECVPNDRSP